MSNDGEARFRFSTDILSRLGEELNPHIDQSILELVKNSYDADSHHCTIELDKVDAPGGTIRIIDDGVGMDRDEILNGWLLLGRSSKPETRTELGRLPVGNKGLGRLAALRMGRHASLDTRPKQHLARDYRLEIDWSKYDQAQTVEDVPLALIESARSRDAAIGTSIVISGLRQRLTRTDVKRLARALVLLADPFNNAAGFLTRLTAPEFLDLEQLVQQRYFDDADFHLQATLEESGCATAKLTDWRGEELGTADHRAITRRKTHAPFQAPSARLEVWAFVLDHAAFSSRSSTLKEVRAWLDEFGGVHLYHRGLRVNPYGNKGDDWLGMNLRRGRHPIVRPSTSTSIGRLVVEDPNNKLVQTTDRSGFLETDDFLELRRFAMESLDWMARRRAALHETRRRAQRVSTSKKSVAAKASFEEAIESLPGHVRGVIRNAFRRYESARKKESTALHREINLYRTLCTVGTTAAAFAHESMKPLINIQRLTNAIERVGKERLRDGFESTLGRPLELISLSVRAMRSFSKLTLGLLASEKRRRGSISVNETVSEVVALMTPHLERRRVEVDLQLESTDLRVMGSQSALEAIVMNLLTNSLTALTHTKPGAKRIVLRTVRDDSKVMIRFMDNGGGIEGISIDEIWLPGETTTPKGTGLGLTIVKDSVHDLGGTVEAVAHGEFGGAEFVIELPVIG